MPKSVVKAVHDDDLEAVLRSLSVYGDFVHGRLKCFFCASTITWDNLHSLFPDSGSVKFSCSQPICVKALLLKLAGKASDA